MSHRLPMTRRSLLQSSLLAPTLATAGPLRMGEQLTVFPTVAHRDDHGGLVLRIEAWVFEREPNTKRTRLLARALGLDLDEMSVVDRQRFVQRAALFGTDAKEGRELAVQVRGGVSVPLPASDGNGRVRGRVAYGGAARAGQWIDWAAVAGTRRFTSRAQWIGDDGTSVVCDIDDTLKHTQIRQRREMLLNTFAREYSAVPGMVAWAARVARGDNNMAFHYVSGSPMQLMPALTDFLRVQHFAAGSMHLRAFSFSPAALLDADATSRHKQAEIAQLLADHPRRRFVLVGDSGERDPETYGAIAREHPSRIAEVLIRDVTGEAADAARYAQAFADVPPGRWRLFTDPASLPTRWT
jgi:Uncharacterized conserved protein (DUF2183)